MRDYNAARASQFFRSIMGGRMMLMDPRVIEERARFAAAMGNPEARMFLRMMDSRRSPSAGLGASSARSSSAPRERDPFLRKLLQR